MKVPISEIAQRLLTPKECLSDEIFDYTEMMRPEVRAKLLNAAQEFLEVTIGAIKGLEVKDICLCGSRASYLYYDYSDVDLKIEIKNKNCPYITKDTRALDELLSSLTSEYSHQGYKNFLGKRFIDIKMSSREVDLLGLYSVKKNKWRIYPQKNALEKISCDELLQAYEARRDDINRQVADLKAKYVGTELARQLNEFYYRQVMMNVTIKDYLVFKLLNYAQKLKPVGAESVKAYNEALSLVKLTAI